MSLFKNSAKNPEDPWNYPEKQESFSEIKKSKINFYREKYKSEQINQNLRGVKPKKLNSQKNKDNVFPSALVFFISLFFWPLGIFVSIYFRKNKKMLKSAISGFVVAFAIYFLSFFIKNLK